MYQKASTVFYILSGFVLFAGLFELQPSRIPEVAEMQAQTKQQFSIAWQQTIGDQPYFLDLGEVLDGVFAFYNQSAGQMFALLSPRESDQDMVRVFAQTYGIFAQSLHLKGSKTVASTVSAFSDDKFVPPADFMAEEPLHNIVPEDMNHVSRIIYQGVVSGTETDLTPGNAINSWITVQDNYTGQPYCLAIYNGEVNKYLGPCKNDYH